MLIIVGLLMIFGVLRIVSGVPEPPSDSGFFTTKLVLVGVTGRTEPDATDHRVIDSHADSAQVGAVSVRTQQPGECAAAGWLTIGAGRRTTAGDLCQPTVAGTGTSARIPDWTQRQQIARSGAGDARLGTLAATSPGCIQAVGPGAALAAADPNGRLDRYETTTELIKNSEQLDCPLTIVDAGGESDKIISALAGRNDVTVLVSGVGPGALDHDRDLQVIYRIGTTLPGFMTSDSTRRDGVVILTDLTRTLISFTLGTRPTPSGTPVDGTTIQVQTDRTPSSAALTDHLRALDNLSSVAPTGYLAGVIIGVLAAIILTVTLIRRWWRWVWAMFAALGTLTAALMLTGSVPWQQSSHPGVVLVITLVAWSAALTVITMLLARWWRVPVPIVAAGLTMATFSVDAALGGLMQPGSLLNSRPVAGGRWYGFGNVTFGCYAAAVLVVAGYVAHRYLRAGHRRTAMIAVAAIGGFAVGVEGWPSMGADFGGVITLTPAVLLLVLGISGRRITWPRLLVIIGAAVVVVAGVSLLDWARGAGHRSHLGDFVQRMITGDAWPIVLRKAIASGQSMITPYGIAAIIVCAAIWVLILRRLRFAITRDLFQPYPMTAIAALVAAALGTLVNDGGISVLLTVTGPFAATTAALLGYRYEAFGLGAVTHGEDFDHRPTPDTGAITPYQRDPRRSGNPAVRARSRRRR